MNANTYQMQFIRAVAILLLAISTMGFAPTQTTGAGLRDLRVTQAASPKFHGFDLAGICRRVYQADGHRLPDLKPGNYDVYAVDSKNAFTLRCKRYAGILAPQNRADGLGDWLGYFYGANIYTFNLYNACRQMNPKGELRLGNSKDPWSWGCWY